MKYCSRYLPILISSSVSASPIHSNWKSCKDCENFCTAMDKSKIQGKEKEKKRTSVIPPQLHWSFIYQTFLSSNTFFTVTSLKIPITI